MCANFLCSVSYGTLNSFENLPPELFSKSGDVFLWHFCNANLYYSSLRPGHTCHAAIRSHSHYTAERLYDRGIVSRGRFGRSWGWTTVLSEGRRKRAWQVCSPLFDSAPIRFVNQYMTGVGSDSYMTGVARLLPSTLQCIGLKDCINYVSWEFILIEIFC